MSQRPFFIHPGTSSSSHAVETDQFGNPIHPASSSQQRPQHSSSSSQHHRPTQIMPSHLDGSQHLPTVKMSSHLDKSSSYTNQSIAPPPLASSQMSSYPPPPSSSHYPPAPSSSHYPPAPSSSYHHHSTHPFQQPAQSYAPPPPTSSQIPSHAPPPSPPSQSQKPKSIFTSPHDHQMATKQIHIETLNPSERAAQETWALQQLNSNASTGACVQGYSWRRCLISHPQTPNAIIRGYRCEGGSHFVSDILLAEGYGGYMSRPQGGGGIGLDWQGPFYSEREERDFYVELNLRLMGMSMGGGGGGGVLKPTHPPPGFGGSRSRSGYGYGYGHGGSSRY